MATAKKSTASKSNTSPKTASKTSTTKKKTATAKNSAARKPATKKTPAQAKTSTARKTSAPKSKASAKSTRRSSKPTASPNTSSSTTAESKRSPASSRGTAAKSSSKRKAPVVGKSAFSAIIETVTNIFVADKPGSTNAVELLKVDHDVVERLFEKVKANEDGNNAAVFAKIKTELDTHTHIEETIFYPHLLMKGNEELKKSVREGIEEHRQVKMFLAELASLSGDSPKFQAKLKVLMEDVEHHVKEEEVEMFPLVEDQIGEQTLEKLGAQMQAEKSRFKGSGARVASLK